MTIYDNFEAFQRAEDERMIRTIRGLAKPDGADLPEEEAVALVEQQTPLFDEGWKCPASTNSRGSDHGQRQTTSPEKAQAHEREAGGVLMSFEKRINDWCITISDPWPRWVKIHFKDEALPSIKVEDAKDLIYALSNLISRAEAEDRGGHSS